MRVVYWFVGAILGSIAVSIVTATLTAHPGLRTAMSVVAAIVAASLIAGFWVWDIRRTQAIKRDLTSNAPAQNTQVMDKK